MAHKPCDPDECCGCDRKGVPLVPFSSGHHYCGRCAEEAEAIFGQKRVER